MITARPAERTATPAPPSLAAPAPSAGSPAPASSAAPHQSRHIRRQERRRLVREQFVIGLVLLVLLVTTVVLLGLQWLDSASIVTSTPDVTLTGGVPT